jgi:hypothetical protein
MTFVTRPRVMVSYMGSCRVSSLVYQRPRLKLGLPQYLVGCKNIKLCGYLTFEHTSLVLVLDFFLNFILV